MDPAPVGISPTAMNASSLRSITASPSVRIPSKIRLISHRSFGFHSGDALIALVYLCCTRIDIQLPR